MRMVMLQPLRSGTVTDYRRHTRDGSNLAAECKVALRTAAEYSSRTIRQSKSAFTLLGDACSRRQKAVPYPAVRTIWKTWIAPVTVTVEKGSSVGDVFAQILTESTAILLRVFPRTISPSITTPNGRAHRQSLPTAIFPAGCTP